jgi:hypothetical protein
MNPIYMDEVRGMLDYMGLSRVEVIPV